jgi:hypothetical protein
MKSLGQCVAVFLVFGVAASEPASTQQVRAVPGHVRSAVDSSALSGVHVTVVGYPSLVLSDDNGRVFFGKLPRTELRISFERIGLVADTAS